MRSRGRAAALVLGSIAALGAASFVPSSGVAATDARAPHFSKHTAVAAGLDNPRQLSVAPNGDLIVAEAGHGGKNCQGQGQNATCVGRTGAVATIDGKKVHVVVDGLLSGGSKDGSFAVGSDGAGKRAGGPYFAIITYAPQDVIPDGLPGWQSGKLVKASKGGKVKPVASITKFERANDPDGEGFDSDPYSLLVLRNQVLVADAAGDFIASVHGSKVSLWALLPEYGKKVDAVPTVVTRGHDGKIYVGELHSEQPGKAKVWQYDRDGNVTDSWGHFTTVTGVDRTKDGTLYVSELFGGKCTLNQVPDCFPGRVVRVDPDGTRSYRKVPFPAGIVVNHGKVFVAAFSISPASGFGGNPDWSGQVWRIFDKG
ncbi:MAG TPA: ScyD/ScyE family protein [Nocardioidaceae bacterium]|nr:ScyD/ScyE family protein [Nocardioidaceae bacterium]